MNWKLWVLPLLILILFSLKSNLSAQNSEWIAKEFPNSYVLGVFKVDDKYFAALSNGNLDEADSSTVYQLVIYEIIISVENGLSLVESFVFSSEEKYRTFSINYIKEKQQWIFAQTKLLESSRQRFRLLLCDKNFNILSQQTKDTIGDSYPFFIETYESQTQIIGTIFGLTQIVFYCNYEHSDFDTLPSIQMKQSEPNNTFFISSMDINKRNGKMLVFFHGGVTELDTNLWQTFRLNLNDINTSYYGSILSINKNYYTHGLTDKNVNEENKYIVLQKYDSLNNVIAADTVGINGIDNFPFITKSLDYFQDEILVGGHLDGIYANLNFHKSIKKFYLSKYDLNLNQIWYKEFGGNKAFVLNGLKLLESKDCLAFGYIIDTLTGILNGYIMYVDEFGNMINSISPPIKEQFNILIENPGKDQLRIFNPNQIYGTIELYDLSGKKHFSSQLNKKHQVFTLEFLPAGIYAFILRNDGAIIHSESWLKIE
jgi:hypothetical protein